MNTLTKDYRLAMDFTTLESIPEDPRKRLTYFQSFKELIQIEKEKIKDWHRSGAGGWEVIQSQTNLIDEVVRHILLSMTRLEQYKSKLVLEDFCLIAVGGYGRGELNPLSDLSLIHI